VVIDGVWVKTGTFGHDTEYAVDNILGVFFFDVAAARSIRVHTTGTLIGDETNFNTLPASINVTVQARLWVRRRIAAHSMQQNIWERKCLCLPGGTSEQEIKGQCISDA